MTPSVAQRIDGWARVLSPFCICLLFILISVAPLRLPVGVVASVSEKAVRIEPLVDWNRLEFVRVVDFGIAGILPPQPSLVPPPRRGAQAPLP